jgi:hypothetical protein
LAEEGGRTIRFANGGLHVRRVQGWRISCHINTENADFGDVFIRSSEHIETFCQQYTLGILGINIKEIQKDKPSKKARMFVVSWFLNSLL